jgi:hypothetical protein
MSYQPYPSNEKEFNETVSTAEEIAAMDAEEYRQHEMESRNESPDDSHLDPDWEAISEGGEDSYLDAYWEDQNEVQDYDHGDF